MLARRALCYADPRPMHKLLLFLIVLSAAASAQRQPDVILVTIDTLRADHVGCFGSRRASTPTLDRLCADGVRFSNAITAAPITNTAHASILTGLYPSNHGVSDFGVPLAPAHVTIAKLLQQHGYSTAAFIGAVILDSKSLAPGLDQGFDHYDNFAEAPAGGPRWNRVERRAEVVVNHATTWLAANRTKPRFVWVHLFDPHDPYEPPMPFAQQFKDSPYDGEIAYADSELGTLLSSLKRQKRYDGALIIVLGDHGEGLGEHNENTHGIFLYDSTLHIPLIVKLPGNAQKGSTVPEQVRSVDVLPTILDRLGISTTAKFDGASLFSNRGPETAAISETDYPLRFGWAPIKSVRMNGSKYIEAPHPELYSLGKDPGERKNIYQPWDAELQKLRGILADFRNEVSKNPASEKKATAGATPASTVEELRALGYLGNVWGSTTAPEPSLLPDPKDKIEVQNLIHAGMMQDEGGNSAAARMAFGNALKADPSSLTALSQLGEMELKAGDYRDAAQHLAAALRLNPEDGGVALHLGQALQKVGDLKGAAQALETALKLSPGQYGARVQLGEIYLSQKNITAAQDQLEAAMLLEGKKPEAHIAMARLYLSQQQPQKAGAELQRVLRNDPKNREALGLMQELRKH